MDEIFSVFRDIDLDALRDFLLSGRHIDCGIEAARSDKLFCLHLAEACGFKIGFNYQNSDLHWRYVSLSCGNVDMTSRPTEEGAMTYEELLCAFPKPKEADWLIPDISDLYAVI